MSFSSSRRDGNRDFSGVGGDMGTSVDVASTLRTYAEKAYSSLSQSEMKLIHLFIAHTSEKYVLTRDDIDVFAKYVVDSRTGLKHDVIVSDTDAQTVQRLETLFREDGASQEGNFGYPKILEHILSTQIELADWFGPDAMTFQTHEYDDYVNGVDLVVQWNGSSSDDTIRLAVDVTVAESSETLGKKMDRVRDGIITGNRTKKGGTNFLSGITYFMDPDTEEQMNLHTIPKVVLGMDRDNVRRLVPLAAKMFRKEKGSNSEFAEDPLQILLLEEASHQLEEQLWLATLTLVDEATKKYPDIFQHEMYPKIYALLEEKKNSEVADTALQDFIQIFVEEHEFLQEMIGGDRVLQKRLSSIFEILKVFLHIETILGQKEKSLVDQKVNEARGLWHSDRVSQGLAQATQW